MDQLFSLFAENLGARKGNDALALFLGKHVDSLKYVVPPFVLFDTRNAFVTYFNKTKPQDRNVEFALIVLKDILPFVDRSELIADLKALFGQGSSSVSIPQSITEEKDSGILPKWNVDHIEENFNKKNMMLLSRQEKILIEFNTYLVSLIEGNLNSDNIFTNEKNIDLFNISPDDYLRFERGQYKQLPPEYKQKKMLFDEVTSYTVTNVNRDLTMRSNIVKLVLTVFQDLLEKIGTKVGLRQKDLLIMFKGGNVLRLFLDLQISNYNIAIEKILRKNYRKFIKVSDNDFQLIYNTDILKDKTRAIRLYNLISTLAHCQLDFMAYYLNKHKDQYFDQFKLNDKHFSKFIEQLISDLKKTFDESKRNKDLTLFDDVIMHNYLIATDQNDEDKIYNSNGGVFKLADAKTNPNYRFLNLNNLKEIQEYKEVQLTKDINPRGSESPHNNDPSPKRNNLFITANKGTTIGGRRVKLMDVYKNNIPIKTVYESTSQYPAFTEYFDQLGSKKQFYSSFNDSLQWPGKTDNIITHFGLNRIKQNYVVLLKKGDQTYKLNVPSEIIDLSIAHPNDNIKQISSEFIQQASIDVGNDFDDKNDFNFITYSMSGLFKDLMAILFGELQHPWHDVKYQKRIKRSCLLMLIDFFNSAKNEVDILKIREMIKEVINDINNNNLDAKKYMSLYPYLFYKFLYRIDEHLKSKEEIQEVTKFKTTLLEEFNLMVKIFDEIEIAVNNKFRYDIANTNVFKETSLF